MTIRNLLAALTITALTITAPRLVIKSTATKQPASTMQLSMPNADGLYISFEETCALALEACTCSGTYTCDSKGNCKCNGTERCEKK